MNGGQDPDAHDFDALDRIEAALARIERAAAAIGEHHRGLQSRHAALCEAVASSLADLDALIADRAKAGD